MEPKEVKQITVTYQDGSEKVITRGICFSVYDDEEDTVKVSCDGVAGSVEDTAAVLAIVAGIAKEMGIDEELINKAEKVEESEK
ncbi:MAG: hypothetical protein IJB80_05590 [Clostridia bacterium]|nr:hypothetical protein [Clostridia bacterium]